MSQMNTKQTRNTRIVSCTTIPELEKLLQTGEIDDYTDDGWIRMKNEWIPKSEIVKQLGESK